MDYMYIFSIALLVVLAFVFNKNHNSKLSILMILIAIYVVYSHETGNTATNFKNGVVDSINESSQGLGDRYGVEGYDPQKAKDEMESK